MIGKPPRERFDHSPTSPYDDGEEGPDGPFSYSVGRVTRYQFYRFLMLDGEKRIIQRAKKGEASAFGLLYDRYQPQIYRFIFLKVSRREEAEDLTHQVFLQALQHIGEYENVGFPFTSWLYRIARNEVIDHYRTKKQAISLDDVDPEYFASLDRAMEDTDLRLDVRRVTDALKQLKPEYQDVIVMRFVEDLSPKEIAVALQKSEGAVKLLQHRAVRQLQKLLKP